jgi:hypothetical protein
MIECLQSHGLFLAGAGLATPSVKVTGGVALLDAIVKVQRFLSDAESIL